MKSNHIAEMDWSMNRFSSLNDQWRAAKIGRRVVGQPVIALTTNFNLKPLKWRISALYSLLNAYIGIAYAKSLIYD